jgi:hypothetical protein
LRSFGDIRRDLPVNRLPSRFQCAIGHSHSGVNTIYFLGVSWREHESGMCAMDDEAITQNKADREILSFDVSDELLERAANAERSGFTLAFCTGYWDSCALPSVASLGANARPDALFD